MSTLDIIFKLMKKNCINARQLEINANLAPTSIYTWKIGKAKPSMDALIKIADYFNVSLDYLTGRDEPTQTPTTTNTVKAIARGCEVVEFEYTDEEMQTILKMLELTKKI